MCCTTEDRQVQRKRAISQQILCGARLELALGGLQFVADLDLTLFMAGSKHAYLSPDSHQPIQSSAAHEGRSRD